MRIVVLDRSAMGDDLDFSPLNAFGEVIIYETTSASEVYERVNACDFILTNKVKITKDVMRCAPDLKLICVFATGYDNIDIEYAKENGIAVSNIPAYSTESVTLFTITTALTLFSRMTEYREVVASGEYSHGTSPNRLQPVYHEIFGKTWGIVGCGNIGSRVAEVAESLGCRILTHQRHKNEKFETVPLETLLCESDIISLHCPLTRETMHLIGSEQLALLKPTAILVNEARGAVCDEQAIAKAIQEGQMMGFGSDVYSVEPFDENHPFYAIKEYPNVCLTPHAAWGAYEARERALKIVCENIREYLAGESKNRIV